MPQANKEALRRTLPLYLGEAVLGTMALAAITASLSETSYQIYVHLALLVGLAVAALGTYRGRFYAWPGMLVQLGTCFLYITRDFSPPLLRLFFPDELLTHRDMIHAGLIGWLLVAFASWQSRRHNLIFMVVCGLAIFGVTGTVNLNSQMLLIFAVFMCSAVFCWGYEQFLEMDERLAATGQARSHDFMAMARGQLSIAVLVGILTFTAGNILGTGAYHLSPNLYEMARRTHGPGWAPNIRLQNLYSDFSNDFQVGVGPVRLMPVPVMEVQADRPALWRGQVYDYYDGQRWSCKFSGAYSLNLTETAESRTYTVPSSLVTEYSAGRLNRQRIRLFSSVGRVFAASQPIALALNPARVKVGPWIMQDVLRPMIDSYNCLSWRGQNDMTRSYSILSREPVDTPAVLAGSSNDVDLEGRENYVAVPIQAKAALLPLVRQIIADARAQTKYDKVVALKDYLETHCLYTISPPTTPHNEDAVDYFVNRSHRGACDLFSTSLVVMARLADIPAREVTGYATGEYDKDRKAFLVKGTDAHAWAEVYFAGYGWVPFDPQARETYEEASWPELISSGHWNLALGRTVREVGMVTLLGVVVFLALAALVDPLRLLRDALQPRCYTPLERLAHEYCSFYQLLLRRAGIKPDPALTPLEAITSITSLLPPGIRLDGRRLVSLNERFYNLRYAPEPAEAEVAALRKELGLLRKRVRRGTSFIAKFRRPR